MAMPEQLSSQSAVPPRPVVIDTDPGIDDALALMLALRSPEFRVELITTVAGNVPVERATANVCHLLALIDPPVWPVVAQGAARPLQRPLHIATDVHGHDGLGGLTELRRPDGSLWYPAPPSSVVSREAVLRLLDLVQHYGNELTVIALGPLTNLAQAIQQAPAIMQQLGHVVIMGGAIGVPGNITPTAEFNIFIDPHAADIVLRAGLPLTLVPLDVTRQVRLGRECLQQMLQGGGPRLAQVTGHMTRRTLSSQRGEPGMALHDPLAVAVALDPSLVRLETMPLCVETRGEHTIGMTVADRRLPIYWSETPPRLQVAVGVDASRVLTLFAERVLV